MKTFDDELQILFERVISDPGPEGAVALEMLRKRIPQSAAVRIMATDRAANPLLRVVQNQIEKINELEGIITDLNKRLLKIAKSVDLAKRAAVIR